jgi:tRNA dimethylallyltransferase
MADRWHPKDRRKIRRSLEIFLMTGKTASEIYAQQKARKFSTGNDKAELEEDTDSAMDSSSPLLFWVHAEPETLKKRLDARVLKMVKTGLLEEVKAMNIFLEEKAEAGIADDRTRGIWVSIGYKEFEPYLKALESTNASEEELSSLFDLCVEQTQAATRQYAKRQVRWIRLKLIPALKDEHALNKLYLFDGSDITKWEEMVSIPALHIASKFLSGEELQPPQEICSAAKEFLSLEDGFSEKTDVWFRQVCSTCDITAVTDVQWQTHLKSRRHRGLMKKKEKQAASARFSHWKNESTASDTP